MKLVMVLARPRPRELAKTRDAYLGKKFWV